MTPATWKQRGKLDTLFGDDPTSEQVQHVLANGDLFKAMLGVDLSRVDRAAFQAVLTAPASDIPWTPVSQYTERIMARSELRGWGFTEAQAKRFATRLVDHRGRLMPTGVSIWLGRDLEYNRAEAIAWLEDEVQALGFMFKDYTGPGRTSFYPGSECTGKRRLDVVGLNLETYWEPEKGLVPRGVRAAHLGSWPGLEVFWLLALNPQVYVAINGSTIPAMFAPGLVVDSENLPNLNCDGSKAYVNANWDDNRWYNTTLVSFREL